MSKTIKLFYDIETTGTDPRKHSIHQIAGIIEVDGVCVDSFDIKTKPHPKAKIEQEALTVGKVTIEQIENYQDMGLAHKQLVGIMSKYVSRYDKTDKIYLVGYNNLSFDDPFTRAWFEQNGDVYFNAWFWPGSLDVMCLASQYLIDRRKAMSNFKLHTVAKTLGLGVKEDLLHDAVYDISLTREIYRIVTGLEIEI